MSARPNLLLITTDQQRWDSLSLYGAPGYRTPVLDGLAARGVCFDRAYCPSPVCTPARVSILTGQYPTRHGAYEIGMDPVPALQGPTIASLLGTAGYRTALVGKTHFVARCIEHQHVAGVKDPSADRDDPTETFWDTFDGPYAGFEFVRHCQSHTCDRPPNAHYRSWLRRRGLDLDHLHQGRRRAHGESAENVVQRVPSEGVWAIDEAHTQSAWINEESLAWIDRQQRASPWFCWVSYQDPHPPYVCPEPYFSAVDMTGVDLGGLKPGETEGKPPLVRNFMEGRYWTEAPDIHYWDGINVPAQGTYGVVKDPGSAIQAYIGMCNMTDTYVGRLLDGLRELDALENTLLVFTTDHGEMLGRHGLWGKGAAAFEDCQRIPAVASWPGGQRRAVGRTKAAFNLVDIMPTFLDAAGAAVPAFTQGVSQLPVIRGERDSVRDWALVDFLATVNLHQQTLVWQDWKLIVYRHADYGELYNLAEDPEQYRNLFDEHGAAGTKLAMLQRLARANMEAAGTMPRRIASA